MLVRLRYTYNPWRAYLIRCMLGAHDVQAHVFHENAMHLYCPGSMMGCELAVEEEDYDDAVELLRAEPTEVMPPPLPESGDREKEAGEEASYLPDFLTVVAGVMGGHGVLLGIAHLLGMAAEWVDLDRRHWDSGVAIDLHAVLFVANVSLMGGVLAGLFMQILPLMKSEKFTDALLGQLFIGMFVLLVVISAIASGLS